MESFADRRHRFLFGTILHLRVAELICFAMASCARWKSTQLREKSGVSRAFSLSMPVESNLRGSRGIHAEAVADTQRLA